MYICLLGIKVVKTIFNTMTTSIILLSAIPIDIVEIVIVKSKDYTLFETLKFLLVKLQEPSRVSRINDKLTILNLYLYLNWNYYVTTLNGKMHREYYKPCQIDNVGGSIWRTHGISNRINDLPSKCTENGDRFWYRDKNRFYNRDNGIPAIIRNNPGFTWIFEWFIDGHYLRENNLPIRIHMLGERSFEGFKRKYIMDYLD